MKTVASPETPPRRKVTLKDLIGSGDKIMLFTLPFLIVGVVLQIAAPSFMDVGGPPDWLRAISLVVLAVGVVIWLWAVALILAKVPHGELITTGPYAVMMHPIYTSVALLVLPWLGFLLNSWLGALVGIGLYVGSRRYAPAEEEQLAETFGSSWDAYCRRVMMPWL
jgi:protein-S-isoprenylcysteine O-methyltransferase Ste14